MIISDLCQFMGIKEIKQEDLIEVDNKVVGINWLIYKHGGPCSISLTWDLDRVTHHKPKYENNVIMGLSGDYLHFRLVPIQSPETVNIRIIDRRLINFGLPDKVNFEFIFLQRNYFIIKKIPKTMTEVLTLFTLQEFPITKSKD